MGKTSLLLVMGFSLIFLFFSRNYNSVSNQAVGNYFNYYDETVAHDLAVSGANMAANQIFLNQTWDAGYSNIQMNGGTIDVSVNIVDAVKNIREIVSEGTFSKTTKTVTVTLQPSKFSKFAYYSIYEGSSIWWKNRDTVFGPFHTQDYLRAANHPVFGVTGYKTTIKKSLIYYTSKSADKPVFLGPFQDGEDLPLPTDGLQPLRDAATAGGYKINQSSSSYTDKWGHTHTTVDTVYITFVKDSVTIRMGIAKPSTTYKTSDIAPNGVIYAQGMDVRLQGTVKGQYSVVSDGSIYLDNDIVYDSNPKTDPNSTDLLGIIAQNNVLITNNSANSHDININGTIYCQDGGFGAESYSTRPVSGNINLLGGIVQNTRQAVGTFDPSSGTTSHGFDKRYRYDERLMTISPPLFPGTGDYEIVSWKE